MAPELALEPFPSLAALRAEYTRLLQRRTGGEESAEFLSEAETFLLRGKATGGQLDALGERIAAQALLNYWGNFLARKLEVIGREPPEAVLDSFNPALAKAPARALTDVECPYRDLDTYQDEKGNLFLGRQNLVQEW